MGGALGGPRLAWHWYWFQRRVVLRDQPAARISQLIDKGVAGPQLPACTAVQFEGVEPEAKAAIPQTPPIFASCLSISTTGLSLMKSLK
jgi:hypothetical protein